MAVFEIGSGEKFVGIKGHCRIAVLWVDCPPADTFHVAFCPGVRPGFLCVGDSPKAYNYSCGDVHVAYKCQKHVSGFGTRACHGFDHGVGGHGQRLPGVKLFGKLGVELDSAGKCECLVNNVETVALCAVKYCVGDGRGWFRFAVYILCRFGEAIDFRRVFAVGLIG